MFLAHRHVRIEGVILEHHGDVAVARAQVIDDLAGDLDGAVAGILEAGDGAQQRALAAARRADQHGELLVGDVEVDAAHGMDAAGVALVQPSDPHICHCGLPPNNRMHCRLPHPRIAPSVSPRTRCFCTSTPSTIDGTSETIASALASPYCAPWKLEEGAEHRRQREGVAARQDEREEELGPAGDEGEDSCGDDAGRRERHGDLPATKSSACSRRPAPPPRASAASGGNRRTSSTPRPAA